MALSFCLLVLFRVFESPFSPRIRFIISRSPFAPFTLVPLFTHSSRTSRICRPLSQPIPFKCSQLPPYSLPPRTSPCSLYREPAQPVTFQPPHMVVWAISAARVALQLQQPRLARDQGTSSVSTLTPPISFHLSSHPFLRISCPQGVVRLPRPALLPGLPVSDTIVIKPKINARRPLYSFTHTPSCTHPPHGRRRVHEE